MHPSLPMSMLLALATTSSALAEPAMGQSSGRVVIRVEATIRAAPPPVRWVEKGGPQCIAANELGGAIVNGTDSVDLVLKGGARVRAQFDGDCNALGYYGGFYVKPSSDGKVCARRDVIRTRSGNSCAISKFNRLVPRPGKRRKP